MELGQTLSINLPIDLCQKLQQEVGKGKISQFIKKMLEEKFAERENKLIIPGVLRNIFAKNKYI